MEDQIEMLLGYSVLLFGSEFLMLWFRGGSGEAQGEKGRVYPL